MISRRLNEKFKTGYSTFISKKRNETPNCVNCIFNSLNHRCLKKNEYVEFFVGNCEIISINKNEYILYYIDKVYFKKIG